MEVLVVGLMVAFFDQGDSLEGICPKCGLHYYGWSLINHDKRICRKCGGSLEIVRDGVITPKEIILPNHINPTRLLEVPPL